MVHLHKCIFCNSKLKKWNIPDFLWQKWMTFLFSFLIVSIDFKTLTSRWWGECSTTELPLLYRMLLITSVCFLTVWTPLCVQNIILMIKIKSQDSANGAFTQMHFLQQKTKKWNIPDFLWHKLMTFSLSFLIVSTDLKTLTSRWWGECSTTELPSITWMLCISLVCFLTVWAPPCVQNITLLIWINSQNFCHWCMQHMNALSACVN